MTPQQRPRNSAGYMWAPLLQIRRSQPKPEPIENSTPSLLSLSLHLILPFNEPETLKRRRPRESDRISHDLAVAGSDHRLGDPPPPPPPPRWSGDRILAGGPPSLPHLRQRLSQLCRDQPPAEAPPLERRRRVDSLRSDEALRRSPYQRVTSPPDSPRSRVSDS